MECHYLLCTNIVRTNLKRRVVGGKCEWVSEAGGEDEGGKRRKKEIMKRSQVPNIHYDNVDHRAEIQNT